MHTPHTEEWTLRIRYPQKKDSGIYECQISTTPPIGYSVYLTVVGKLFFYILYRGKQIFLKENQIKTYALEIAFYHMAYFCWKCLRRNRVCHLSSVWNRSVSERVDKRLKIILFFTRWYLGNPNLYRDELKNVSKGMVPRFLRSFIRWSKIPILEVITV